MADVPVIFLSIYDQDQIIGRALDAGATDYVVKPFSPVELTARIRAALRKRATIERTEPAENYLLGDLVIDYGLHEVTVAGHPVPLTGIQYQLLQELSVNADRVVTYRELLQSVWRFGNSQDLRPMRTAVRNLRRKLGDDARNPKYIFNVPRVGYRMPLPER